MRNLAAQVRKFLDKNISSFEDLQILLLLQAHPGKIWNAVDVAEQLRIEPISASSHLMHLFRKGLLIHDENKGFLGDFQYNTTNDREISELAGAFQRDRMQIVEYITRKNVVDRLQSSL